MMNKTKIELKINEFCCLTLNDWLFKPGLIVLVNFDFAENTLNEWTLVSVDLNFTVWQLSK